LASNGPIVDLPDPLNPVKKINELCFFTVDC